ncbi:MAG: hypothetical protein L0Y38_10405 [Methylococcaceae bacterium]|nr:hypothetical protein [Methylococcaceae bacterium]
MINKLFFFSLTALIPVVICPKIGQGQQVYECFVGTDYAGGSAILSLATERYGDYYEVMGTIRSAAAGTMQIKADGWFGAGRMFRGYEYESGALYIKISDYTGSSVVISVEGYGSFPFQRTHC